MSGGGGVHVLAVCTGNICRSPTIERLLLHRVTDRFGADAVADWRVESAGTWGHEGSPMEEFAQECLRALGADPDGFVARELTADMVGEADLVLAATREHRASVVTMDPGAFRRTFTLLEFARLLGGLTPADVPGSVPSQRMLALTELAASRRGQVQPQRPRDDDLGDPYGAPLSVFTHVAADIDGALTVPLALLG